MQKRKKKLLGLLGLAFVALMTTIAYLLPANGAFAESAPSDSHTDVIRVTVYDQFPAIKINTPLTETVQVSPEFEVNFTYENSTYVEFTLSYENEDGDVVEVALPTFNPDPARLDPVFMYDSDTNSVTFNLDDYGLIYGHYTITAKSVSPIGYDEDAIEFYYTPAKATQTGSADVTNDPVVLVEYDDGVAMVEVIVVDSEGNPILAPVTVEVPKDTDADAYLAGSKTVTLPFTENGFETGDYQVIVVAYSATTTPGEVDPDTGEQGEDTVEYHEIVSPLVFYPIVYVQPPAPDVPDTGRFLGGLNIAQSDIVITSLIAFVGVSLIAFLIVSRRKKDYRKNLRRK